MSDEKKTERAFGDTIATPPPDEVLRAARGGDRTTAAGGLAAEPTIAAGGTAPAQRARTEVGDARREASTRPGDGTAKVERRPDEPTDLKPVMKTRPGDADATAERDSLSARIEHALRQSDDEEEQRPQVKRDPLIGVTVANRFVIESKIGAGGMGAVYKARQLGMDRHVAIKVLLAEYAKNPMLIKRFHMEALAVSKLEHPNTIRIFDFGQTEQGVLFIAMEFLAGRSLEHELRAKGALAARRAAHIMAQVCRSLGEAHAKGIVHRDLKPDNIFLCNIDGDTDYAKVLDFGVAKLAAQDRKQGTMTQAGMVFGTPKYMSPEQSRSDITDARSDIYALGIILYEMLAGKPPFDAENPLSILIKHVQEAVKPFSVVRPDILIPPPIERIVEKCLRKKADERYQSAEELAEALLNAERALDRSFDKVISRDEAEKLGLDLTRDEAFTTPGQERYLLPGQEDETEPMSPEEAAALLRRLKRRRRRKVGALATAAAVVLLGVGTLIAWFNLPAAPDGFQRVFAQPLQAISTVPALPTDTVRLTLASLPAGATVYAGEDYIGRAPLELTRWRDAAEDTFTFKLDGYEPLALPVPFATDGEFTAELSKLQPQVVERVVEKVVTKEVPVLVERPVVGGGGGRDRTRPTEPTGPVTFTGGKVGDLKKLKK